MSHPNLFGEPPATLLPADDDADRMLAAGEDPAVVAGRFPAYSAPWADLAERALADGRDVEGYAYARVGYHRGLDALRRSGWKGHGPVPWSHEPNRGFLRCLHSLSEAANRIDEDDEWLRCAEFLRDCDPAAIEALGDPRRSTG